MNDRVTGLRPEITLFELNERFRVCLSSKNGLRARRFAAALRLFCSDVDAVRSAPVSNNKNGIFSSSRRRKATA